MELFVVIATLTAVAIAFGVSATAGLGGSLVLVPSLALVLGTKQGVALSALLLAGNNVVKVIAYRSTLPFRKAASIVVLVALGAGLGARLLVWSPERLVTLVIIVSFCVALVAERLDLSSLRSLGAPVLAFGSGPRPNTRGRRGR